jgi:hypothetical protein
MACIRGEEKMVHRGGAEDAEEEKEGRNREQRTGIRNIHGRSINQ